MARQLLSSAAKNTYFFRQQWVADISSRTYMTKKAKADKKGRESAAEATNVIREGGSVLPLPHSRRDTRGLRT